MKTRTDAQFGTTSFAYDSDERLTFIDRPGTTYDATTSLGRVEQPYILANSAVGSAFGDDGGQASHATDGHDRRPGLHDGLHPDANDNLGQIDYPSGFQVKYQFDSENRITDVGKPGSRLAPGQGPSATTPRARPLVHGRQRQGAHADVHQPVLAGCHEQ